MFTSYSRNFRAIGCNSSISEKVNAIVQFCTTGLRAWPRRASRDFNSGCRNSSHHCRQQSFSGLHSAERSDYTIKAIECNLILSVRSLPPSHFVRICSNAQRIFHDEAIQGICTKIRYIFSQFCWPGLTRSFCHNIRIFFNLVEGNFLIWVRVWRCRCVPSQTFLKHSLS